MLDFSGRLLLFLTIFLLVDTTSYADQILGTTHQGISAQEHEHPRSRSFIRLSLPDAVALGIRRNRSIRSAHLLRLAQRFDLRVAEDMFSPKLVLGGKYLTSKSSVDRYRSREVSSAVSLASEWGGRASLAVTNAVNQVSHGGRQRSDSVNFSMIQPLLRGAGKDVAKAPLLIARLSEYANRLALDALVAQSIRQIVVTFREVLRAQERIRIAESALKRSRELLSVNRALVKAGRMAEFDVVQTQADIATQELGVEEAQNQFSTARLDLLTQLDLDLGTQLDVEGVPEVQRIDITLNDVMATALSRQPDYLLEQISQELASIRLAVARSNRQWDVSLVGGAAHTRDRYVGDGARDRRKRWDAYMGIQIEIPIGDLSYEQGYVHARVSAENTALKLVEARRQLERKVGDSVNDLGTRWRQHEIAQRALELSKRKLEIERQKLRLGRSSNFQVLSYETDLRNAEISVLNSRLAYLQAQTDLDLFMGVTLDRWGIEPNV